MKTVKFLFSIAADYVRMILELQETSVSNIVLPSSVADTGFPRGGRQPRGGINLLFGKIFAEKCINMKTIGLRGYWVRVPRAP